MPFQRAPIDGPTNDPSGANPSDSGVPTTSSEFVTMRMAGVSAARPFGLPEASVKVPAATVIVP